MNASGIATYDSQGRACRHAMRDTNEERPDWSAEGAAPQPAESGWRRRFMPGSATNAPGHYSPRIPLRNRDVPPHDDAYVIVPVSGVDNVPVVAHVASAVGLLHASCAVASRNPV